MHEAIERPRTRTRSRERPGALLAALAVSALVHAIVFFAFRFEVDIARRDATPVLPLVRVVPAMQVFELTEVAGDVSPIEVQIIDRELSLPAPPRVLPPGPPTDEPSDPVPLDPLSVRDRLRYRLNTPQVWRAPTEEIATELTDEERAHLRVASRLGEYNDSVAAEAELAARSMDWTVKDEDGNRWGVSPGAIHLGSITIPLGDSHFVASAGRREEFEGRVRTWTEIQLQATRVEAGDEFKDRVKAIEERKAKEREEKAKKSGTITTSGGDGKSGTGTKPPGGNR